MLETFFKYFKQNTCNHVECTMFRYYVRAGIDEVIFELEFWKNGINIWPEKVRDHRSTLSIIVVASQMCLFKIKWNWKLSSSHFSAQKPHVASDYHTGPCINITIITDSATELNYYKVSLVCWYKIWLPLAGRFIYSPAPSNSWLYNSIMVYIHLP